ncbi:MAG: lipopolysaccharide biosynthesis protein [Bradymonadaceae bacterium]|nr:lipopolysaccharide biosynthesis protein [Lujinxingiaceae bacterium]
MGSGDNSEYFTTEHLDEDIGRRTVQGGAITAVAQVVKSLVEIGATIALARLLMPQDFGLVGMVVAVTGFLAMFKDLGLSMATIQRARIDHAQVSTLFWINLAFSVLIMVVTVALAPVIAWFFDEPRLIWITVGLAGAFVFSGLTVQHDALLRRQMRFGAIALVEVAALVLSLALAVWLAVDGWGYWALVARQVLAAGVAALGVWLACSWRPGLWSRQADVRSMLGFGGNLTGFNFVNYFARNLDDILIGRFYGAAPLGLYQKAYEVLMIPLKQINNPVSSVAIPALSRLRDDAPRYRAAYLRILEKVLLLTMPLGAYLVMTADWLVLVVLGEQWIEAGRIFAVLGVLAFSQPLGNSAGWLFITQDRTREMLYWGLVGSALAALSFVAGLPWGALGVAAAYAISGLLVRTPILLWYVGRRGPVSALDIYRTAAPYFATAAGVVGALVGLRHLCQGVEPLAGLVASLLVTIVVTLAVLGCIPSGRRALVDSVMLARKVTSKGKKP